jgi:hypothetical protein
MMPAMSHKPHHHRHHRHSQRSQVLFLSGLVLVVVLALLGFFLWLTNSPKIGSH